jgi:predicted  nucleic acid-binding Zn-ribbon protein
MAKRIAAQRRGLLYGLIAAIFVAVVMTVLFFIQMSDTQNLCRAVANVGPDASVDVESVSAKIKDAQHKMENIGVLPSGSNLSLTDGIDRLIERCNNYSGAIGELAYSINAQSPSNVQGEALMNQAGAVKSAAQQAMARATDALKVAPQAGVGEAKTPPSLVAAIDEMAIHVNALTDAYKKKEDRIKSLEANNGALEQSIKNTQATWEENLNKMKAEKDATIAGLEQKVADVQKQADAFEKQRDADKEAANKAASKAKADIQDLVNKINLLNSQIKELVVRIARAQAREFEPDGKIVRLAPGEKTGYVNLGTGDGVFNGLIFSVFDPAELGKEKPQPKGGIRLTNVMADSSEFQIESSMRNNPIVEGDLITNPAFDRERKFQFAVVGLFDINGDGSDDTSLIKDLIRRFGGAVQDRVTVETDYVVVGKDPMSAMPSIPTGQPTPQQKARIDQLQQQQKVFGEATDLAQRLHIPVLTQNRFLSLIGFPPPEER